MKAESTDVKNILGLQLPTDPRWVNLAEIQLHEILTDHAWCEQKAALTCISLIQKNFDKPKVDLHALLAAPSASARERKKALDHVEEMYGYDLPLNLNQGPTLQSVLIHLHLWGHPEL